MDEFKIAFDASWPAILVSFFFLAIAWKLWKPGDKIGHWGTALALPLGFTATYMNVHGSFSVPWPPIQSAQWLLYAGFAGGLVGLLESTDKLKPQVRYTLYVLLAAFIGWVFPGLRVWRGDDAYLRWVWTVVGFLYVLFALIGMQKTSEKDDGPWLAAAWSMLLGLLAFAVGKDSTGKLSQLCIGFSAVLGVAAFIGFVHKRFSLKLGGTAPTIGLFSAVLIDLQIFTEVGWKTKLPVAVAPFLFWLVARVQNRFVRILLWLLIAAVAGGLAVLNVLGQVDEFSDY